MQRVGYSDRHGFVWVNAVTPEVVGECERVSPVVWAKLGQERINNHTRKIKLTTIKEQR